MGRRRLRETGGARPLSGVGGVPTPPGSGSWLFDLDGALHVRVEPAHILVDPRRRERLGMTLALEKHGGALLALRERDLVRRVVAVRPRHGLPGPDRQLGGTEDESRDAHVVGARLHRDGAPRRLTGEPGQRAHEVLLLVRLVALEAPWVVGLVVELAVRGESRVLPLTVAEVYRVLGPPPRPLLHDRDADDVALEEAAVGVLERGAGRVHLCLVLDERQDGAARHRLAFPHRLDGFGGAVELAVLLVVVAVDRRVEDVVLVVRREGDLLGPGAAGQRRQDDGEREHQDDERAISHSTSWVVGPSLAPGGALGAG